MLKQEWFQLAQESPFLISPNGQPMYPWQILGFKNAETARDWIRKRLSDGTLKLNVHVRYLNPHSIKSRWLINIEEILKVVAAR